MKYEFETLDSVDGYVKDVKKYNNYNRITVKNKGKKYYIYDYNFHQIKIGDRIEVMGISHTVDCAHIEGGFDYQQYLKHHKINGVIKANHLKVIGYRFDIGIIRQKLYQYLSSLFDGPIMSFLNAIILGDSSGFEDDFMSAVKINGISHLFAISGLHVGLLVGFIYQIFRLFNVDKDKTEIFIIIFLGLYAILVNFTPSIIRAVLLYDFYYINKKLKLGFSSLDLLSLIFIILIIVNPYYIYHYGFILSFLVTLTIMITSPLLSKTKHSTQIFLISLFSWLITLPIIVNLNNEINILSPLVNVLYIDLVGYIILPFSLIVLFFPILLGLYRHLITFFINFTVFLSKYIMIRINFPDFTFLGIIIYYLILWGFIKGYSVKKYKYLFIGLFLLFLLLTSNIICFKSYSEVVFLDLYNGESILICDQYNRCNVVIDTGDGRNKEVTSYLKRRGIKKIDYLIITHNHHDHNGEASEIIKEFTVNNIVVSAYDNSELSSIADIKVKKGDKLGCGNLVFHILHPDAPYLDENDNSIVVYVLVGEYYFLFLGDVGNTVESKIALMNLKVDVVKIAHHGSANSTSPLLLANIKPRYAVIQTGRIEQFGFPAEKTIATLQRNNVTVYRTDQHYSVKYKYSKKKSIFITIK
ncbi:MAG: DNA internalization-related competence protein ComEC/Rec2 [Bacilli bacterium]|nr:DNA internalization-related competence protein ComEC/Rec2 [Bacilli bacterium]MDD4076505.1 DNA internalization-related competence protein ComEC/Rec2 [Bacilli bacterium]MDD4387615.1 DNA internalization-related competence protein ComEC/Rec2 [Bacilli bacterium]